MKVIVKTNYLLSVCLITCLTSSFFTKAEGEKSTTITIESKVKGSQEQPNVIYITPWQDNTSVINIENQKTIVKLPQLKPVNPVLFKKKLEENVTKK